MATTKPKPKTTEIIVDENTVADVIETKGKLGTTQTIKYQAQVKQNESVEIDDETENLDNNSDNEAENTSFSQQDYQEIPKDKIDVIFDELEIEANAGDYFYAKLTRLPDAMQDSFFNPCSSEMPLGVFQFSMQDRFSFLPAIQKRNNNSGGRFNVTIFDSQQKPFQYFVGYDNPFSPRKQPVYKPVGATNLLIPNPMKEDTPQTNGQTENFSLVQILAQMQQKSDERMERLLLSLREKSVFEKAIEQKMMNDILNPPQNNGNNNLEEKFMSLMMMPQVADRMARKMFPDDNKPAELTTFDKILKASELPVVQNALERIGTIAEFVVDQKFNQNNGATTGQQNQQTEQANQPQQIQNQLEPLDENMQALITEIITHLESDNELTKDSEIIQRLVNEYPEQFETVKTFCEIADFQQVLSMLITRSSKFTPFVFAPFIDTTTNTFNERGNKLVERLQVVYVILKSG